MSRCSWWTARPGIHAGLEVQPPHPGDVDLGGGQLLGRLAKRVEQHDQTFRSPVEHAVVLCAKVAAQLSELPFDLGAVGEGKVWHLTAEQIETCDLVAKRSPTRLVKRLDEIEDGLAPVGGAIIDRLKR